jgi:GT2 family glycosyltransferase
VPPKVYIIVINWNGELDTIECLESLTRVDYDDMHVIVSDNGSRPESLRTLYAWACDARLEFSSDAETPRENSRSRIRTLTLLANGRNLGFTGANTVGIRHAMRHEARYVMFLNNDTTVTASFLSRMVATAERDPNRGIIGCKTFQRGSTTPDGRRRIWSLGGYEYVYGNPMNLGRNQLDRPEWKGELANDLVCGCCMLIRREVIETVGVQDDSLFFGIDDVEYSYRAAQHGWTNVLALDAEIDHEGSQSVEGRTGLQLYYLFRNTYYFRTKYFPWYRNVMFFAHHLSRYFVGGGLARIILGRGRANIGMVLGIYDFLRDRMGSCAHRALLERRAGAT